MSKREMLWNLREDSLPALSIQQPFAEAILVGRKTIEVRTWATSYRGPLVIQAGQTWYRERINGKAEALRQAKETIRQLGLPDLLKDYPRGALLGIVELANCFKFTPDEWERTRSEHCNTDMWRSDLVGWTFENPRRLFYPVRYSGALGLFPVSVHLIANIFKAE